MTTPLEKTLKRELQIKGRDYIVAISPEGLKVTLKGHRNGVELNWESLVTGDAALAIALNASVGQLASRPSPNSRPNSESKLHTSPNPRATSAAKAQSRAAAASGSAPTRPSVVDAKESPRAKAIGNRSAPERRRTRAKT
jgi:hypothetical protein